MKLKLCIPQQIVEEKYLFRKQELVLEVEGYKRCDGTEMFHLRVPSSFFLEGGLDIPITVIVLAYCGCEPVKFIVDTKERVFCLVLESVEVVPDYPTPKP